MISWAIVILQKRHFSVVFIWKKSNAKIVHIKTLHNAEAIAKTICLSFILPNALSRGGFGNKQFFISCPWSSFCSDFSVHVRYTSSKCSGIVGTPDICVLSHCVSLQRSGCLLNVIVHGVRVQSVLHLRVPSRNGQPTVREVPYAAPHKHDVLFPQHRSSPLAGIGPLQWTVSIPMAQSIDRFIYNSPTV